MSIRPVDLQMIVQKSPEVNRLNQQESNRPEIAHQQFSEQIKKETEQSNQHVIQTMKSEKQSVDKDGRGSSGNEQKRKNRNNRGKLDKNPEKAKNNSLFDVTI